METLPDWLSLVFFFIIYLKKKKKGLEDFFIKRKKKGKNMRFTLIAPNSLKQEHLSELLNFHLYGNKALCKVESLISDYYFLCNVMALKN